MLHGALRSVELTRANVQDIATHTSGAHVLHIQGKGKIEKDQFIILTEGPGEPYHAIMEYLSARGKTEREEPLFASCSSSDLNKPPRRISERSVRAMFRKTMENAKLFNRRITAHSTRASSIDYALLSGAPLREVSSYARHAHIDTTMRYASAVDRMKGTSVEKRIAGFLHDDGRVTGEE